MKNLIDVTVALPLWDMGNISWLQLESLCRQETTVKWELIVCEEQFENFTGKENIISYKDRLRQVGCKSIKYIPLFEKIPLSKKWTLMAHIAEGKTYLLAGGDDYSAPNRIEFTHQMMCAADIDWFDVEKGLFYNINTGETCTYDHGLTFFGNNLEAWNNSTALSMGIRTILLKPLFKYLNNCEYFWPSNGVDNWMRSNTDIRPDKFYRHQHELLAVDTDGANKISADRTYYYSNNEYFDAFRAPSQTLKEVLPHDIFLRLTKETFDRILKLGYT